MTRSVEIPEAAVGDALRAFVEHRTDTKESRMRAALLAALPYLAPAGRCTCTPYMEPHPEMPYDEPSLEPDPDCPVHFPAPAGDGGLRETLVKLAEDWTLGVTAIGPARLRDLLAAHPAAPAVPPTREQIAEAIGRHGYDPNNQDPAQDATRCLCGVLVEEWDEHWADAVLAVSAGEQEQVGK